MKIALVQIQSVAGDIEGNLKKILEKIKHLNSKAGLIIFPEMVIPGYCISDLIEDNFFVQKNKKALEKIAEISAETRVIVGFIDYDDDFKKYNSAAIIEKGKLSGIAHKTLLPNYRYFDEKRYFSSGKERRIFNIQLENKKISLGITICEDMWNDHYEINPIQELKEKGAEIIININASPYYKGKYKERERTILKHINKTGLPFVYVNSVGSGDNGKNIIPFDGNSSIYNQEGKLIASLDSFIEGSFVVDLTNTSEVKSTFMEGNEAVYNALVMGLREYAKQAGFSKAIVPVSGGIDSSLGLAITVEAFGKKNVVAYNLPSRFNSDTTKNIAFKLSKNWGVEYRIIPIQKINNKVVEVYQKSFGKIKNNVAKENLHSRIRGMLMMLVSNDEGALLVSNGNKTEIALGYATLYGDMCGGISVIGDLSKTEVYSLSKYVNEKYGREMIPEEVFEIKPSAELSKNQYDPFDYEMVSPIVDLFIEERLSPIEVLEKYREKSKNKEFKKLVFDIYELIKKSVYKRLQGPPIITVTKRSFGFDLRETLINKWKGK